MPNPIQVDRNDERLGCIDLMPCPSNLRPELIQTNGSDYKLNLVTLLNRYMSP